MTFKYKMNFDLSDTLIFDVYFFLEDFAYRFFYHGFLRILLDNGVPNPQPERRNTGLITCRAI